MNTRSRRIRLVRRDPIGGARPGLSVLREMRFTAEPGRPARLALVTWPEDANAGEVKHLADMARSLVDDGLTDAVVTGQAGVEVELWEEVDASTSAPAVDCPPLRTHYAERSNVTTCSCCGQWRDVPHTWQECAKRLASENEAMRLVRDLSRAVNERAVPHTWPDGEDDG